uniref:Sorting nexin 19b n=1 Tax=Kryptolebias marmoratus TaxID=37003 RepID=A0A3Q3B9D0_KRYMA
MAEVLGQRSLLGFGVVLAWLMLFHLLVNIWLLCVFTSLLLVLGGWFGSQAILESNSVIHLERFIPLEKVQPSAEDERYLDQEIHNTVRKIIKDFVTSWYSTVSSERRFEMEVQEAMISMAMELKQRARHVDRMVRSLRDLKNGCIHVQDYLRAKELVIGKQYKSESEQLWKAYSSITTPHLVMNSDDAAELNYVRAVVDLLLHVLVPSPHLETRTGRFVVGELITCNVLIPFVAKLSDPDWLNLLMIEILGKSTTPQETLAKEPHSSSLPPLSAESEMTLPQQVAHVPETNNEVPLHGAEADKFNNPDVAGSELTAYDVIDSEEVEFPQTFAEEDESTQPFLRHCIRGKKSNPFYQENDSDLDSPLADYKQSSTDSLLMVGQEENLLDRSKDCASTAESNNRMDSEDVCSSPVDDSCPKVLVNSVLVVHPNDSGISSVRAAEGVYSISSLQDLDKEGNSSAVNPSRELLLGKEQTGMENANELNVTSPSQGCSPVSTFSFEPLSSPEGPVIIQNLRITGTITAKEHRGTGSHPYTLYTIKVTGCETPSSIQPVAYHMVNRRYSEFLNLQTRLEEKGDLRKLIKGVKGPKKLFPDMPFGNMDSDKIEARKGLLETFLKQLCAIPEIANSEEMQEFLALNTDARIAFVKKPFIVSRIDKIVVNAIVGTLKTAFPRSEPQSPTEDNDAEVDGGKICTDKKSLHPGPTAPTMPPQTHKQTLYVTMNRVLMCVVGTAGEMVLADVALNILCLLMKKQWSWLCTENIQRTIRLLFGTFINRWLDVSVANLTSTRYWVVYLQVIQEAVWPGGTLPTAPRLERSQHQKDSTKQQALNCLMKLLPDLVSDMLGSDKYKLSWQTALNCFQNPYINRYLCPIYCDLYSALSDCCSFKMSSSYCS